MDAVIPAPERCEGCGHWVPKAELAECLCLGCMNKFLRCRRCYPTSAACGPVCRENHRARLARIFAPGAPPIAGPADKGPGEGDLL